MSAALFTDERHVPIAGKADRKHTRRQCQYSCRLRTKLLAIRGFVKIPVRNQPFDGSCEQKLF